MLPSYHPLQARALVRPSRVQHPGTGQWVEVRYLVITPWQWVEVGTLTCHLTLTLTLTLTVTLTPTLPPSLWRKVGCERVWDTQQIYGMLPSYPPSPGGLRASMGHAADLRHVT